MFWDASADRWVLESGEYRVKVGASSRDLCSAGSVVVTGDEPAVPLARLSTIGELLAHPIAGPLV